MNVPHIQFGRDGVEQATCLEIPTGEFQLVTEPR